jgi:transcriptional regulator with PAS, ATPase and Fis domain
MERRLIEEVLERHEGHRQRAARELGIGVRTLGLRLKRWREEAVT